MGIVGSSVFGAWPVLVTKSRYIYQPLLHQFWSFFENLPLAGLSTSECRIQNHWSSTLKLDPLYDRASDDKAGPTLRTLLCYLIRCFSGACIHILPNKASVNQITTNQLPNSAAYQGDNPTLDLTLVSCPLVSDIFSSHLFKLLYIIWCICMN